MAAEYFTSDLLTGSKHSSQQKSAQFLSESCNMKDKTTSLLFKIHKDSFGYWAWARRNSSNARDMVWHTLSWALVEFRLAQTQYPNEPLCILNKRLVVLSFVLQLSLRNCADFCWLLSREPVKRSGVGVKVQILGNHFCVTQLLI